MRLDSSLFLFTSGCNKKYISQVRRGYTRTRPLQPGWSCACGAVTGEYPGMNHLSPLSSVCHLKVLCSQCRPSMLVHDDLLKVFGCSRHSQGDQQPLLESQGLPSGPKVALIQPPLTPSTKASRAGGDNRLQVLCSAFKSLRVLRRLQPLLQAAK